MPLYWEPKGLLPWGHTTNGTYLCWSADGDLVDKWKVVALRPAAGECQMYDLSMVEFLTAIFSRKAVCSFLPEGLPGDKGVAFEGWKYGTPAVS